MCIRAYLLCAATVLTLSVGAFSDTVLLRSGKEIQGVVIDEGGERILIKTDLMDVWVSRANVRDIRIESPPDHFVREGERLLEAGEFDAARSAFIQALEMDSDNVRVRQALDQIEAMSPEERKANDRAARVVESAKLLQRARHFADRALLGEAMETMARATKVDPANIAALELAGETFLQGWTENRVPVGMVDGFIEALEKADPGNPRLPILKDSRRNFLERRRLTEIENPDLLYEQVLSAEREKIYDAALLNKIERLLESGPDSAREAQLRDIQAAIEEAGVMATRLSLGSARGQLQTRFPFNGLRADARSTTETLSRGRDYSDRGAETRAVSSPARGAIAGLRGR